MGDIAAKEKGVFTAEEKIKTDLVETYFALAALYAKIARFDSPNDWTEFRAGVLALYSVLRHQVEVFERRYPSLGFEKLRVLDKFLAAPYSVNMQKNGVSHKEAIESYLTLGQLLRLNGILSWESKVTV